MNFALFNKKKITRPESTFFDTGFHGDKYLLGLIDTLVEGCKYFIETGTDVGSTLSCFARTYPEIRCLSCEPHDSTYEDAVKNISGYENVTIYNTTSQKFLKILRHDHRETFGEKTIFWLDAHGLGFNWPLKKEISFITKNFRCGYILIDDFKVPGLECFGYDEYNGQVCSFDYIKGSLNKNMNFSLFYPTYTEKTSDFHPLRGWGLIAFGQNSSFEVPKELENKIRKAI